MDRLALYAAWIGGSSIAGALVVAAFSMGYYSPWVIVGCVVAGALIAYPTGKLVSVLIKRWDPAWNSRKDAPRPDLDRRRD